MAKLKWQVVLIGLVCFAVIAVTHTQSQGSRVTQPQNQGAPYVMLGADSGTFLLNSQTGQVWMFVTQNRGGKTYYAFSQVVKGDGAAAPTQ